MRELVGQPLKRIEDPRLLRGEGRFVDDIRLPGVLHAAYYRSPHAHARLNSLDLTRARQAPGVIAVFTAADLPDVNVELPATAPLPPGGVLHTQTPLVNEVARFVGEMVAIVVADDRYRAEDALELIEADWEPLPVVTKTIAEDPGAGVSALVWPDAPANVAVRYRRAYGDIDAAFADADAVVVAEQLTIARSAGVTIEPRGVLAVPGAAQPSATGSGDVAFVSQGGLDLADGAGVKLTLFSSTQAPHRAQSILAGLFNLAPEAVRVIAADVGGGFGVKGRCYPEDIVLAATALKLGRPVKWVSTRREDLMATGQSRGQVIDVAVVANRDGTLRGVKLTATQDCGAYIPGGVNILNNIAQHAIGPYKLPALHADLVGCYTHRTPLQAVRGNGRPEGVFVIERMLDRLAEALELEPAEIRRRNLLPTDAFPYDTGLASSPGVNLIYDSGDFPTLLDKCLKLADYDALRATRDASRAEAGKLVGLGWAAVIESTMNGPEGGRITVKPDGKVIVHVGSPSQGQGHQTVFRQLAADRLGVDFDDVEVVQGDTGHNVMGIGTFGSRLAASGGNAIHVSVTALHDKARALAAEALEVGVADLEIVGDRVQVRGSPRSGLSLRELAEKSVARGESVGLSADATYRAEQANNFAGGVHLAVVEVDRETGHVALTRYICAHDCGLVLNPLLVDGQVQGGVAHGVGNVLLEACVVDEAGQLLTGTLMDYAVPTADEVPGVETAHLETLSPFNPEGIKGAGEGGTIGAFAAVANAVEDALRPLGGRVTGLPITAEVVRRQLAGAR